VETPGSPAKKPSLFWGGLIGYIATTLLGSIVCWLLAARSGDFDNQKAFTLLVCFGVPGAFEGYRFVARRRKRLGVSEPSDEWQQFVGSWTFKFLAALVLAGSFAISFGESLLFDLVYGAPWLQNR
jgi:hypothetical protein